MANRYIYKPLTPYIPMGLKEFIQRLFPRGYVSLDARGVSRIISQVGFLKEGNSFLSFSFFNDCNRSIQESYSIKKEAFE